MRSSYAFILSSLLISSFALAADAISTDGSIDLSSESTVLRRAGGRSDQSLTDERLKVREFIDSLMRDENRKPSQDREKSESSSSEAVAK